jgi:CRISPR-associated protein Cas4
MEPYIQISQLNDFIFCPKSIYFHGLYKNYNTEMYHSAYQTTGKIKHETIDLRKYSTEKKYMQSLEVYSAKYGLCGKIDLYDSETKTLTVSDFYLLFLLKSLYWQYKDIV